MSTYLIHQAFTTDIVALLTGITIGHENQNVTPPTTGIFASVVLIPNVSATMMKDALGLDEATGIYQISLSVPDGEDLDTLLTTIDTVTQHYKHTATITAGAQTVIIENSGRNAGRNVNGRYGVDITVNYRAFVQRV